MNKGKVSTWFENSVKFDKVMENGMQKKVTEKYVVEAVSWTDAETSIIENSGEFTSGEIEIVDISKAKYSKVMFSDDADDGIWYKTKIQGILLDEKTEKEKKYYFSLLIQASSLEKARVYAAKEIEGDNTCNIVGVNETKIMDVFENTKEQ